MDAVSLLRKQFEATYKLLENTITDVTPEQAHWVPPGIANPIGASYAHVVIATDAIINVLVKHTTPLLAGEWADKTGASEMMPIGEDSTNYFSWTRRVQVDLPMMRQYAAAVYAATDEYLATLTPDALDQMIDLSTLGAGQVPLGMVLSRQLIGHIEQMCGEISCLKGLQGATGYRYSLSHTNSPSR